MKIKGFTVIALVAVFILATAQQTQSFGESTTAVPLSDQPRITTLSPFPDPETAGDAPCSDLRPTGMDIQTVDMIAAYHLDRRNATGITAVSGSQKLQRAYRIGKGAKLSMPLRQIFPAGLPNTFSVVATFRSDGLRQPWSLIKLSDSLEFAVTLLPISKRLSVLVRRARVREPRVNFQCPELFHTGWHRIHITVSNHTLRVAVDCKEFEPVAIPVHDFNNATSVSIVSYEDGSPAPVDLQWLSISCDAYNLTADSCNEIAKPGSLIKEPAYYNVSGSSIGLTPGVLTPECNGSCPPGPAGPQGLQGNQGERGFTGLPGIRGEPGATGSQGLKGDKGDQGTPGKIFNTSGIIEGVPGPKGEKGELGQKGERGEAGLVGLAGLPGIDGRDGARGPVGPVGPPGVPGTSGVVAYGNTSILRGEKGEKGDSGEDGRPGVRGYDGARGSPGLDGAPGVPGVPGQRGPVGPLGEKGERGSEGPQGPEGPQGQPGPPGPPGASPGTQNVATVSGVQGPPGEKGQKGEMGPRGYPGKDGLDGIPGSPGQRGPPGLPASMPSFSQRMTPSLTEKEVQNICEDLIRARFGELTANLASLPQAIQVKRGPPGRPGPSGTPGTQGDPGEPGPRGYPGATGEPGKPGNPGMNGEKGEKGDRGREGVGVPGIEGLRGLPGPIGPPGPEGRMGMRGDPGREGALGPRGVQGPRGTCDCPTAAFYAYAPQMNNKGP